MAKLGVETWSVFDAGVTTTYAEGDEIRPQHLEAAKFAEVLAAEKKPDPLSKK